MKKKIWIPMLSIFAGLALLGAGIGVGILIPRTTATIKPNWEKPFWVKINDWEINKNAVEDVRIFNDNDKQITQRNNGIVFNYNEGSFIDEYKIAFGRDGSDHSKDILNLLKFLDSKNKDINIKISEGTTSVEIFLNNNNWKLI